MSRRPCFLLGTVCLLANSAYAVLFDLESIPIHTPLPTSQAVDGLVAVFSGGYSIQDINLVILMTPTGFSGHGLSPNSVFKADLMGAFKDQATMNPALVDSASILVAPQELACDSSATMRITAYLGSTLVATKTQTAPQQDVYMWPTIDLGIAPGLPFDNIVVHWVAAPPTGGDYGVIFVADNLRANPVPEPGSLVGLGFVGSFLLLRRRTNTR
jgi:hypothetical protein